MENMSFLPENEIRNVILDWKFEKPDVEINSHFGGLCLGWPKAKYEFSLFLSWGDKNYLIVKSADVPFELSGTISLVTAEKAVQLLGQFENLKFNKDDGKVVFFKHLSELQYGKEIFMTNTNLTFRIHLWQPSLKNGMVAKYYACFRRTEQKCNFAWIVKSETDDSEKECFTKYVTQVPRAFRNHFTDKTVFEIKMALEFGKSSDADIEMTIETSSIPSNNFAKFKIDAISEDGIAKPLSNSRFIQINNEVYRFRKTEAVQELMSNKSMYYPKGYLKLQISVTVTNYSEAVVEDVCFISDCDTLQKNLQEQNQSEDTLKTCMYTLYSKGEFCDVTLCTKEEKFPCHKAVLCARSTVFKAMFENDMSEKENGLVNVTDVETRALGSFLKALYTDTLDGVDWECALEVYAIADKYDVPAIQKACRALLLPKLSTSNVCEVLELADTHQDKELKIQVEEFVFKHSKEIIKSAEWSKLTSRNPFLTAQVMQLIISERF